MAAVDTKPKGLQTVSIDLITSNRLQPRTVFDDEKIRELADSIREDGIIQPLIVTPLSDGRYELIAGERRLRASRIAGLTEVPVVIKSVDQTDLLALSLIENIQREDLNPLEEARAYAELLEQFHLTQDEVAKRVGKSRVAVANSLRLLKLPTVVQDDVASGRYSAGHARALLAAEGIHEQLKLREWIVKTTPTVRNVEHKVAGLKGNHKQPLAKTINLPAQLSSIMERLRESLGTKVSVSLNRKGGGKLIIDYYSWQDLDRLYRKMAGT
jgi:ParB family chromosome partitioning protein